MLSKQSYCSLIACTEMDDKSSCGKRFAVDVQERYKFDKLQLSAVFQMGRRSNIFPNTLTNDLYPLNVGAFEFKKWVMLNSKLPSSFIIVQKFNPFQVEIVSRRKIFGIDEFESTQIRSINICPVFKRLWKGYERSRLHRYRHGRDTIDSISQNNSIGYYHQPLIFSNSLCNVPVRKKNYQFDSYISHFIHIFFFKFK